MGEIHEKGEIHIPRKAVIVGIVGPAQSGKATVCQQLKQSWEDVRIIEASFGDLIKQDLASGDIPEAFLRSLWHRKLHPTSTGHCRAKPKRARSLQRLGYTPTSNGKRASQIRRAFVAFVLKHYGACYFVNRLESHLRDLFAELQGSDENVIVLISDIQLAEEAYWARVHAPLVARNEPTILIGVSAGKRRRQARAPEVYQNQISIAELESQPDTIECDFVVDNNGTLAKLKQEVASAVSFINRRTRIAS